MSEPAGPKGNFSIMDPTTTVQISTSMPQVSVDGNWTERNINGSLFASLGVCETWPFLVAVNSVMLAFSFCGLVTNALVLWLLGFCIKRNPFSVYILNLAGVDFLYLCFQIVRSIILVSSDFWDVPLFVLTLTFFFYSLGLNLLVAISIERCLSVLFPIWYRCQRPKHTSATVCFLLWTFYLLGNLLEGDACGFFDMMRHDEMSCLAWDFFFIILILFLVCLLCLSSLTLILKVQSHTPQRGLSKLYLLILFTILMFLLCGLPLGIFWFFLYWLVHTRCVFFVFQLLSCVNSSTNPLIYFFLGSFRQRKRREPLRVVLQRALNDEAEIGEDKDIPPTETMEMLA